MNYHLSPDELVSTLDTLDVPFLAGDEQSAVPPSLTPVELLTALAQAREARLCEEGRLRSNISVVVDGRVSSQRLRHKLTDTSEVHFLPAISGG
jgi:molybdopterin converting factor small subunit